MNRPDLVFAETSPYGSVEALIEQDDEVAFFYLRTLNEDSFGMKSCWIRNLVDAPNELDRNRLSAGAPPVLPAEFCHSKSAQARLDEKQLRVVWFEEGDGAALLENDEVIAIIPPWSGTDGFDGYSKACKKRSPFCWEFPDQQGLFERINKADRFWQSWQSDESPWAEHEPRLLEAYENKFGAAVQYYSMDGGNWPPRTLAQFSWKDTTVLLTVGVSICPQPKVELAFEIPNLFRRFELAACFDEAISSETVQAFSKYMSAQASLPWDHKTYLAHGHSVSCSLFLEDDSLPDFSSIFLAAQNQLTSVERLLMPDIDGDPINLLWCVPLFEHERKQFQDSSNIAMLDSLLAGDGFPRIHHRSSL